MGFIKPDFPDVDPATFMCKPLMERMRILATDWVDQPRDPKDNLGDGFAPNGDPRRNPFDLEAWHECDVFRAEVERRLATKP